MLFVWLEKIYDIIIFINIFMFIFERLSLYIKLVFLFFVFFILIDILSLFNRFFIEILDL